MDTSNEFSTVANRAFHVQVPDTFYHLNKEYQVVQEIPLNEAVASTAPENPEYYLQSTRGQLGTVVNPGPCYAEVVCTFPLFDPQALIIQGFSYH